MPRVVEPLPREELDALQKLPTTPATTPARGVTVVEAAARAPSSRPTVPRATGRDVLLVAASLGLVTGSLESLYWAAKRFLLGEFTYLHREVFWMAPAMYSGVFLAAGLLLVPIVRKIRHPALLAGVVVVLTLVAAWSLLLLFGWLHMAGRVLLAVGLAAQAGRWFARNRQPAFQCMRWATCLLFMLTIGIAALQMSIRSLRESATLAALPDAADDDPNVLLIVMGSVRADALGLYGAPSTATPHLDRLAQRGVRFEQAISTSSWSLPSTAGLMTGRLPSEITGDWSAPLDSGFPTLAEFLADRGYATGGFVANDRFCTEETGISRGFAHYEDHEYSWSEFAECTALGRSLLYGRWLPQVGCYADPVRRSAADVNEALLDWTSRQGRPWFAFVNYLDAHVPYAAPAPYNQHRPETAGQRLALRFLDRSQVQAEDLPLARGAYADGIQYLDAQICGLMHALESRGDLNRTLIVITADHGEHFGEHGLLLHGNSLYEPLVHVPLLMIWPERVPAGGRVAAPVSLAALPATLQELLAQGDGPFAGEPLSRHWEPGGAGQPDTPVMAEYKSPPVTPPCQGVSPIVCGSMQSVRLGKMKYIRNADGREELFDVAHDPAEQFDLAPLPEWSPTMREMRALAGRMGGEK